MARCKFNDLMYSELLTTPGYDLVFAIGTTYSLSLEALLMVPISFGLLGELDDNIRQSPICLLEAVRRSADKFVLFCNKGGIAVPKDSRKVYSLLEGSIAEVYDRRNHMANFHPKIWIIKEKNCSSGDLQLKIVVMSRNLTFDNSIDTACSLTGRIGDDVSPMCSRHAPVRELLRKLKSFAPEDKKEQIGRVMRDLDRVVRFEVDGDVFENDSYEFFPLWFGRDLNLEHSAAVETGGNTCVTVSPFIDRTTLGHLMNRRATGYRNILITRKDFVDEGVFALYAGDGDIYAVSDTMLDNNVARIDLHAKMFWTVDRDGGRFLYLGSANATHSGFYRNTEFLMRLKYKKGKNFVYEDFVNNFINEDERRFERIDAPYVKECSNRYSDVERTLREFICCGLSARAVVNDGMAVVTIDVAGYTDRFADISLSPLQLRNLGMNADAQIRFEGIPVDMLSELYVVSLKSQDECKSQVIKIKTCGIPENRDNLIFRSIVDTPKKFIDYVSFMVTDQPAEMTGELACSEADGAGCLSNDDAHREPRVYEQMLKMAYNNPEQLKEIGELMNRVDPKVVSPRFKQMYDNFMSVMKTLERL